MVKTAKSEARIFTVETSFAQGARRPGGVSREHAIDQAEHNINELKADFDNWLDQTLEQLRSAIQESEGSSFNHSWHKRAYECCSQLRDVGTTMGFALITFIANNLCKILQAIDAGKAYDKAMITCHVDALFLARTEPFCKLSPDQLPEMTDGLRRVVELVDDFQSQPIK